MGRMTMTKHRKQRIFGKPIQKPFTALTLAEIDATGASMTAELPGRFRWEKLHKDRYHFDPCGRAASMSDNSIDLTGKEQDAMIEEVFAECEWEDRQRLLAAGIAIPEGASVEDVEQMLGKIRPPTFGSERWFRQLLIETLLTIRTGCKSDLDETKEAERDRLRDPDKYVHLCIPGRHRRLYRLAEEWNKTMPWIAKMLDPKDEDTAVFVMAGLKSIGIDAYVVVRLRDLHEERRVG